MEKTPTKKPFYKKRWCILVSILPILAFLVSCSGEKKPVYQIMDSKDVYVQVFDVKPVIDYDEDENKWYWFATFKTTAEKWTELKCEVTALASDKKTELASYEYPHNVVNNGIVVMAGDFAIPPYADKSLVDKIKFASVQCKKW